MGLLQRNKSDEFLIDRGVLWRNGCGGGKWDKRFLSEI